MLKVLQKLPMILRSKKAALCLFGIVAVFVAANGVLYAIFRSKTYPNTSVAGKALSSSHKELESAIEKLGLLPPDVKLKLRNETTIISPDRLGISINHQSTAQKVKESRSWLPVWNLLTNRDIPFDTAVNDKILHAYVAAYSKKHENPATNAKIVLKNAEFSIAEDKPGSQLEIDYVKRSIIDTVSSGQNEVTLEPSSKEANTTKAKLEAKLATIKKQQATPITLKFGSKAKTLTASDVASMFDLEEGHAELADANIQSVVTRTGDEFGILVENIAEAVATIKQSVTDAEALTFTLVEAPKPTAHYGYCVAARGVATSHLGGLSSKLASVFADDRGWGLKGQVTLTKVASGCDFTVWLSAASQMPTFGAICEPAWSCRIGPNVVINFDRWQGATTAWNQAGGSLSNYRVMVINHEVGHWFGYYHAFCGGAGQLAPVMQQQSIDLQGCRFNPWPTASELASHKRTLGL